MFQLYMKEGQSVPDGFDGFDFPIDNTSNTPNTKAYIWFDSLGGGDKIQIGDKTFITHKGERSDRADTATPKGIKGTNDPRGSRVSYINAFDLEQMAVVGTQGSDMVKIVLGSDKKPLKYIGDGDLFAVYKTKQGDPVGLPIYKSKQFKTI